MINRIAPSDMESPFAIVKLRARFRSRSSSTSSGSRAISRAIFSALARKPQLALLDMDLNGAGSGLDVAHLCSDLGIPAVFVSGSRLSPEERDGAAGCLSKPYLPNDLLQAVEYFRSDCHSIPPVSLELFTPHNRAHRADQSELPSQDARACPSP
jgi:CheY-like chemotaxis protein